MAGLDVVDEPVAEPKLEDFSDIAVDEAIWDEIKNQEMYDTFTPVERETAARHGWKHISTKLHITVRHGILKARFVAREFRGGNSSLEFFAATTTANTHSLVDTFTLWRTI